MHYRSLYTSNVTYCPFDFIPSFPIIFSSGSPSRQTENLHFHNCIEIVRCLSGSGHLTFGSDTVFPFAAGDFCWSFPHIPHAIITDFPCIRTEYLYIEPHLLQNVSCSGSNQLWQALYFPQRLPCIISEDGSPDLFYYLSHIFEEMKNKKPLFQKATHGLLLSLLTELNRFLQFDAQNIKDIPDTSNTPDTLKNLPDVSSTVISALTYIYNHYSQPVSVSLIASQCGVSVSHLRRLFSAIVGISPLEFIQQYRI